jgi:hypothetical protein
MLDGVPSDHFDGLFAGIVHSMDERGGLEAMRRLGGRVLIALDGSEHFCSRKVSCPQCSTRQRSDGETEYFHTFLSATMVAPGHKTVLPLPPEFIRPQDGAAKQDCENRAAKRWLERVAPAYAGLRPVYLGDDLYANQPMCRAIRQAGGSFLLICKPASHKTLWEHLDGGDLDSLTETHGRGTAKRTYRYRWMNAVPIRDGKEALASVLVVLNLLAFALHTGCDLTEAARQKARERFRARTRMFTHLATITTDLVFPSWSALMRTLTTGAPPPQPP